MGTANCSDLRTLELTPTTFLTNSDRGREKINGKVNSVDR
ncbi:19202_t:CDS:2 [Entrophospora sp. SA101]|nr:13769_t:CDS:2 [Entrophospora sp. SA101]CAJ0756654.1 15721_t:CDS:2 [Entrophospora sp. SA101]CAJ0761563.1 19202_t:CDS:2 [Entrophospora sp. SA101]CAJ0883807.1 12161_t:CDS:2 [Entrophospora sp. SA101]CAJ0904620.1 5097_t:CDS:2 [Entrophospora sp. SA101]